MAKWPPKHNRRGPNGRRICRCGCEREIPRGRRSWYEDDCWIQFDWNRTRFEVSQRDKGVCKLCGLDCISLREYLKKFKFFEKHAQALRARLNLAGSEWSIDLWQADHIVPQVEGGTHELSNLRTLCIWCHKKETAGLTSRRAEARRVAKDQGQELFGEV